MAENQTDDSQKTLEPTPHRLEEARKKGQIPLSREVNHAFALLGFLIIVGLVAPYSLKYLTLALRPFLEAGDIVGITGLGAEAILSAGLAKAGKALLLPAIILIAIGLASGFSQTQFIISAENLKPKFEKLSLAKGVERIFSKQSLNEFGKGMFKLGIVGGIVYLVIRMALGRIDILPFMSLSGLLHEMKDLLVWFTLAVLIVVALIAAADYMYQRFSYMQKMRMSHQDVKQEHKDIEGDPQVKQQLARLRRQKSRQRIATDVPTATMIITNPTHYAVALKYEAPMRAPVVVAKGVDFLAHRIMNVGRENDVPIIENPPLARALYSGVEVEQEIPEQFYTAVAKIVRYLMGLEKTPL